MDIIDKDIENYAFDHTAPEPDLLRRLSEETHAKMQMPQMLTGRLEGRMLKLLARISGARRVLEIGTFTGYSALSLAEGLPEDGKVVTLEIEPAHAAMAKRYFDASPHGKKVEIRLGPALETLAGLPGPFDLAFIDADKENYPAYYERTVDLVRPGGLILVDNALWSGLVLKPHDRESLAIDAVNKRIARDGRVENVLLTVRDGLQLVRKKD
ncbi:MAG TPA: class I SAM-dependent methyltransferase [Fibrobacteria bacterium]|nr:class I SAM-dependent methyltransferase [Fibrobacteria bacterium]